MKLAFASDDGRNITTHFGRAEYYVVIEIEDGQVLSRRLVPKQNHHSLLNTKLVHRHGLNEDCSDGGSEEEFRKMFAPISDCLVLVARGMGTCALRVLLEMGPKPILTDLPCVDDALPAYLAGDLEHRPELVH